ncbi:MAG: FAD-dependent oxidoreductase [Polyangiaceae bacterium]|nr:FAD-dependent oxidoreductase [Polyangiaceae bacterium]
MTSRRGFLLATAGGFAVGQLAPPPRASTGALIGASHNRGHLLRDAAKLAPPSSVERADVVIVGGGVSGLSAAWRLSALGVDAVVLELESFIGGTSSWGEDGVVPHPWGAHYLPVPNIEARPALRLLADMGVLTGWDAANRPRFEPRMLCHAPDDRIFYRGAWHLGLVPQAALEAPELAEVKRFVEIAESYTQRRGNDGRFFFQIPIGESSRDPEALELDQMTMAEWLDEKGFTSPFVRWFVKYATLDDFGADLTDVSAWAGLHYFAARKLEGPELEGSHYLVWPEGNGHLVRALLERTDARIVHDAVTLNVEPTTDGASVLYLDASTGKTRRIDANGVLLAVPGFIANRIAPSVRRSPIVRKSSPWVVANLHVERPITNDLAWDSVIYESEGLGYVDASHQLTPPREPTVLTYFRAFGEADVAARRRVLEGRSWELLARDVFEDLGSAHPDLAERTSRIDFAVWGHAMPRPTKGFLGATPFEPSVLLDDRIAWAHVDQQGIALFEEGQRAGVVAAEAIAEAIGVNVDETWL